MRSVAIVFLLISLIGCKEQQKASSNQYQMSIAPSGHVYLLNQMTGEIKTGVIKQNNKPVKLTVGSMYETEKGIIVKYIGDNKFEKSKSLDQY